jgi:hypothetical protein
MATATRSPNGKVVLDTTADRNELLPPPMVVKAKRGAELKAIISAAKKELAGIDEAMQAFLDDHKVDQGRDATGRVLIRREGRTVHALNQGMLKAAHPQIVAEFTFPRQDQWVGYPR